MFVGRDSKGVRGIRLAKDDEVIAMSALSHVKVGVEERDEYLAAVNAARRLNGGDYTDRPEDKARDQELAKKLELEEFVLMRAEEEFLLTIAADGFGKRSSAYEYRIASRGGKGITNIDLARGKKKTRVAAAFSVIDTDQIVMVSDGGQIIRCPIDKVSIVGRSSRGVTLFKTSKGEEVVSVSRLRDVDDGDDGDEFDDELDGGPDGGPGGDEAKAGAEKAEGTPAAEGGDIETEEKAGEEPAGEEAE